MKLFLKRLVAYIYMLGSVGVMMAAIGFPIAMSFRDAPPVWLAWIIYPLTVVAMASQEQVFKWIDTIT